MNKYTLRQTPLAVAIGTLLAGGAVEAATITVDTNADPGAEHQCSLRSAIRSANSDTALHGCVAGAGADEIVFDEDLAESTITLSAGERGIFDTLTITGPVPGDAAGLVIDGNHQSRIVWTAADLGLDRLTLTGVYTSTNNARGGAIYALDANLSLAHVMVTGNSTVGDFASGGGLGVRNGDVTLSHSAVSGNSTDGDSAYGGGMIVFNSNVTLTHSTASDNSTGGLGADGGGLEMSTTDARRLQVRTPLPNIRRKPPFDNMSGKDRNQNVRRQAALAPNMAPGFHNSPGPFVMENKEERPAKEEIDMLERMIRDQIGDDRKDKDKVGEREQDKKPDNPDAHAAMQSLAAIALVPAGTPARVRHHRIHALPRSPNNPSGRRAFITEQRQ